MHNQPVRQQYRDWNVLLILVPAILVGVWLCSTGKHSKEASYMPVNQTDLVIIEGIRDAIPRPASAIPRSSTNTQAYVLAVANETGVRVKTIATK